MKLPVSVTTIALRFVNLLEIRVKKQKPPVIKGQGRTFLWCGPADAAYIGIDVTYYQVLFLSAILTKLFRRTCYFAPFYHFALRESCTGLSWLSLILMMAALLRFREIFCAIFPKTLLYWKFARGHCLFGCFCFRTQFSVLWQITICWTVSCSKYTQKDSVPGKFLLLHCPKVNATK